MNAPSIKPEYRPIILRHVAGWLASTGVILSMIYTVGKPHAETVIKQTVEAQGYAKAEQLRSLEAEINSLRRKVDESNARLTGQVSDINDDLHRLERQQTTASTQIDNIEKLAKEQRQLLFQILQQGRQMQ